MLNGDSAYGSNIGNSESCLGSFDCLRRIPGNPPSATWMFVPLIWRI